MNQYDYKQIINKRFGLRQLLNNKKYHNYENAIDKEELTEEKEPNIRNIIKIIASQLIKDPLYILSDDYTNDELINDWKSLEKKVVLENEEIIHIDARSRAGHKILDKFMPHFWDVQNHKHQSVSNSIQQSILEKALFINLYMHTTPYKSEIRRMIVMTCGMGNVTKYRTTTAKAIVQYYKGKRIFDPCIGWGGRMLGTLASFKDSYYVGCEPDINTYKGLTNILNIIPNDVRKRATIFNSPVESIMNNIKNMEKFDIILTSPPYFNLEIYTSGLQSISTYSNYDDWIEKWLKPLVLDCLSCLNPNGVSCWSVKNIKSDKIYNLEDIIKSIHTNAGWKLHKTIVMNGSGRPGTKRISNGKEVRNSEEETYCFKKNVV